MIRVKTANFISAEPGIIPDNKTQVVVLSFGDDEGPVDDKAITTKDALDLVRQVLDSLATLGEPLAQTIGEQFFKGNFNEG